jgi:hypothetical protein
MKRAVVTAVALGFTIPAVAGAGSLRTGLGGISAANLDGSGQSVSTDRLSPEGIGVDAGAQAGAPQPGSLSGVISLNASGGTINGYRESLGGELDASGTKPSVLSLALTKATGTLVQTHGWGVQLTASEFTTNPTKASITVNHPLGPGGADGEFNFTFSGPPQLKSFACGATHNVVKGTLAGTIRIKVGDHFFKTITITRMTGTAQDTFGTESCLAPCPHPYSFVQGSGPYSRTKPSIYVQASTQAPGRHVSNEDVSVFEPTAGTPFLQVTHVIEAVRTKSFLRTNANLTSATVSTPGGALSGGLSFKSSGAFRKPVLHPCRGGHDQVTDRLAKVTNGRITATFDSIGKVSVDTNLNSSPGFTELSHVS